jgi:VanZ family protein
MMFKRRMVLVLTALYWVVLFVVTHLPPARVPRTPGGDKLHHFLAYFILSFMLGATLWQVFPARRRLAPLLVLLAAAVYGIVDELTQIPVGRQAEVADWVADVSGAAVGALLLTVLQRRSAPRSAPGDSPSQQSVILPSA